MVYLIPIFEAFNLSIESPGRPLLFLDSMAAVETKITHLATLQS